MPLSFLSRFLHRYQTLIQTHANPGVKRKMHCGATGVHGLSAARVQNALVSNPNIIFTRDSVRAIASTNKNNQTTKSNKNKKSPHHKHNCICTPASLGQSITRIKKLPKSCKEWCSSQRYVSYKWSLKCTWPNCMACSECSSEC